MTPAELAQAQAAAQAFSPGGRLVGVEPLHRGHIHDTFISSWELDGEHRRLLHQRMNDAVFQDIPGLMHNIRRVTRELRRGSWRAGDRELEVLRLVPTTEGESWAELNTGAWRTFAFVEDTVSYDRCLGPEQAFDAAAAFGNFQARLFDLDARGLVETIPEFFSPLHRFRQFMTALREDRCGRADSVAKEVRFVLDRRHLMQVIETGIQQGRIPVRVIHGDTKLNNVLFDSGSGQARCIVDLDTCMPGWPLYDFGDLVRFTAATSDEDEQDLSQAGVDQELYGALSAGWMETTSRFMNADELELMPLAAQIVTLTVGVRFLTDHLAGDTYFKISREGHNLDRARVQLHMVEQMETMDLRPSEAPQVALA